MKKLELGNVSSIFFYLFDSVAGGWPFGIAVFNYIILFFVYALTVYLLNEREDRVNIRKWVFWRFCIWLDNIVYGNFIYVR